MIMLINNKKGISPLIATILVIGITVVIAVFVTIWLFYEKGAIIRFQYLELEMFPV